MVKLSIIIVLLLVSYSCKSSHHGCDAYGCKENITKSDKV